MKNLLSEFSYTNKKSIPLSKSKIKKSGKCLLFPPPMIYFLLKKENTMEEKNTFERIYAVVKQIPKGQVATYGQIAELAGNKRWSRVVGYALHVNPDPDSIPCHRVVNRLGEPSPAFAFGGKNRQVELLSKEGVSFIDGKVDMKNFKWEIL